MELGSKTFSTRSREQQPEKTKTVHWTLSSDDSRVKSTGTKSLLSLEATTNHPSITTDSRSSSRYEDELTVKEYDSLSTRPEEPRGLGSRQLSNKTPNDATPGDEIDAPVCPLRSLLAVKRNHRDGATETAFAAGAQTASLLPGPRAMMRAMSKSRGCNGLMARNHFSGWAEQRILICPPADKLVLEAIRSRCKWKPGREAVSTR
eukprot:763735-Hanusia_phi.AAC.2